MPFAGPPYLPSEKSEKDESGLILKMSVSAKDEFGLILKMSVSAFRESKKSRSQTRITNIKTSWLNIELKIMDHLNVCSDWQIYSIQLLISQES